MENSAYPDGGTTGWLAVLMLWTRNFTWVGTFKGLGVLLSTLQDQFETSTWIIGWMISLMTVASALSGITAKYLGRRFGTGGVVMVCGAMASLGLITASLTSSTVLFACITVVFVGTSFGISGILAREAVCRSFDKNLALAVGLAKTGGPIGLILLAPFVQLLLNTYGWRGTLLLMGGFVMHLGVCGALLLEASRRQTMKYQNVALEDDSSSQQDANPPGCFKAFWKGLSESFDLALLRDWRFWSVAIVICCSNASFGMWVIYFVSLAHTVGFSLADAATFVTVGGVGGLIAMPIQGILVDREVFPCWSLMMFFILIKAAVYGLSPWLSTYWPMMVAQFLMLAVGGPLSCLQDVLAKQVLGADRLAGAYGWAGLLSVFFGIALGFTPGLMYDTFGDYKAAFLCVACLQFLSTIPILILKCCGCIPDSSV